VWTKFPRWVVPVLAAAGLGLLAVLIVRLGPARILQQVSGLRAILPAVLALTGAKYVLQTAGWRLVLPKAARPPWSDSARATLAGDAIGYLTWAGPVSGEPTRAVLTRHLVPIGPGLAAGAAERVMYNATAAALVALVLLDLAVSTGQTRRLPFWTVVLSAAGVALWIAVHRRAAARRGPPERMASGRLAAWLDAARTYWREHRAVAPALALLCLAQHAMLVAEAYLMLGALGAAPTVRTALAFEALTKIVNTAGLAIPGRLGVSEGGSALLAGALGFTASYGLSLALMRRVRALIWSAVGLLLLPVEELRARRSRIKER
jgi:hypothetical protein